jgi:tRNA1(Val) A37 N6-methylase TrmN6
MNNKFSKDIFSDKDAFYMSTPEIVAEYIANQLAKYKTSVELCCGVGMLSVQLAKKMDKVIAIDINKERIENAKKNAKLYGVSHKIEFITGDVLDEKLLKRLSADVAILDPDWSKNETDKSLHVKNIDNTQPSLRKMFNLSRKFVTKNIVARIPKTLDASSLLGLGVCRVENIIWNNEIKFKVAYFFDDIKKNEEVDIIFSLT